MSDDQETTLDLNQIMEAGMEKFQGELEEAALDDSDSITPASADGEGPREDRRTEDGGQTTEDGLRPGGAYAPEGGQTTASGPEGPTPRRDDKEKAGTEGDTPKPLRFKSHEEAEDGYRHLQAATTRAQQEAARLRDELKKAQEAEQARQEQVKRDEDLMEFMAVEHEKALDAVDELDPDAEDYRKKVARIWATKDTAIERMKREAGGAERRAQSAEREEGSGGQRTEDGLRPVGAYAPEGGQRAGDDGRNAWNFVTKTAEDAGIDPQDDYFVQSCALAPAVNAAGEALSFDDQVQWAVRKTKDYNQKQLRRFQERQQTAAAAKAAQDQEANLPLGRSPADRSAQRPATIPVVTLDDAIESAMEERRL